MLHKIKMSLRIIITILITSGGILSSTIASDMPSKTLIVVGASELVVAFLLALVLDRISSDEKIKVLRRGEMIHLGDITKISGYTAPVVDCIIGGSPCQDLSVAAGKRAGLEGERSGLLMEQIRIVKEMRQRDAKSGRSNIDIRPRYMVWENVPGAFCSNKGEDFRVVLEEVARISEEGVSIPRPPKGKWETTGVIIGDGYSIAWRVFDAKYWGVPQRRRRICLVADFNGHSAAEILFNEVKHNGSTERGNSDSSIGHIGDKSRSEVQPICEGLSGDTQPSQETRENSPTGASGSIDLYDFERKGFSWDGGQVCPTLTENNAGGQQRMPDKDNFNCVVAVDCRSCTENDVNGTLQATACHNLNSNNVVRVRYIVRRLTPLECERLQGYPDGWTDIGEYINSKGKKCKTSDASRYKALGNSIALPSWRWVLKRISAQYERTPTMASLFDGIGGFPLIWEGINGKGTCLWASEIEEFPIAVTKERIG